jgi:hypothetical protein
MKIKSLGLAVMLATLLPVQEAAANVVTFTCEVVEVATLHNRVHLHCNIQGILMYFAVPTSSSAEAQRLVTMGTAALVAGPAKTFWVTYDAGDLQGASYGCQPANCRRPIGFGFRK